MHIYFTILAALATWRITHMVHAEDGPGHVIERFRSFFGSSLVGQAIACFYCLSVWISLPLALAVGESWTERLLLWPALSAVACIVERLTARPEPTPIADYYEDPERTEVFDKELSNVLR